LTARSLTRLVLLGIRRDLGGTLFSAFGVCIGVGSLVFFVAFGLGVARIIREKIFPVDRAMVEVAPPAISVGSFGTRLDQERINRLAALEDVAAVYRKMNVRLPALSRYEGAFFGAQLRMRVEVLAMGVDAALLGKEARLSPFADPPPGQPIPGIVSTRLLEIYNKSFAPPRNLPQLTPTLVLGFTFPVEFNSSMISAPLAGEPIHAQVQVVGASDHAMLAGITIPLETAIRINRAAHVDADTFTGATLLARSVDRVPHLVAEVKKMGLKIDDPDRQYGETVGVAVMLTTSAFALLSGLICLLAAANIAHALSTSIGSRASEIGIMRAVGGSRADIRSLILAEAALIGLVGGGVGTLGAVLFGRALDAASQAYLPPFPFKPETFFQYSWEVTVGGIALGVLAALVGAYGPSRRAAAIDPAQVLAQ